MQKYLRFPRSFVSSQILYPPVWHRELFKRYQADYTREYYKLDNLQPS